jgi:hypothetical protein
MKKIIFLTLALFAFHSALPMQITCEQADDIVLDRMSRETQVFTIFAKNGVQTEMTIATAAGETIELDYACWVYYISYTEAGRYLIVDERSGNLLEINTKSNAEPDDLEEWRTTIGIVNDDEFCLYFNSQNSGKSLLVINAFLRGLSNDLNDEQKLQALTVWLKSHPCIVDATIFFISCILTLPTQSEIIISFEKNGKMEHLVLDISMSDPLKASGYHDAHGIFGYRQTTGYIVGYETCGVTIEDDTGSAKGYIFISEDLKDTLAVYDLPPDIYDFPAEIFSETAEYGLVNASFPEQYRNAFKVQLEYALSSEEYIQMLGLKDECVIPAMYPITKMYENCVPVIALLASPKFVMRGTFP